MTIALFDPLDVHAAWPAAAGMERAYLSGMAQAGVSAMVTNVRTRWLALRSGQRLLPVTVNDGERGDSYVCLPHSAYALYAREELDLVDVGGLPAVARPVLGVLGAILLAAGVNHIVHLDNWLLSTNLHGDWQGEDLPAIRRLLATRFPDHVLAIRSVDHWSCPGLLAAAAADGWTLVPSRQIWVTDDLARDWTRRNAFGNDRRLLARSGLTIETLDRMSANDAKAIADLYRQLYIAKYSALNPLLTARFVAMTHAAGMIRYRIVRGADGFMRAAAGCYARGGILTPPVVGYDMSRSRSEGLYRVASFMFMDQALQQGLRLNGSAGAAGFKRLRGARGVIEYTAMFTGHLSAPRRFAIHALAGALERFVVPMMQRKGL